MLEWGGEGKGEGDRVCLRGVGVCRKERRSRSKKGAPEVDKVARKPGGRNGGIICLMSR